MFHSSNISIYFAISLGCARFLFFLTVDNIIIIIMCYMYNFTYIHILHIYNGQLLVYIKKCLLRYKS